MQTKPALFVLACVLVTSILAACGSSVSSNGDDAGSDAGSSSGATATGSSSSSSSGAGSSSSSSSGSSSGAGSSSSSSSGSSSGAASSSGSSSGSASDAGSASGSLDAGDDAADASISDAGSDAGDASPSPADAAPDAAAVCLSGPSDASVAFITTNWGDNTIRVTPDIHSLDAGATATPREITGELTSPESEMNLTIDSTRGLAYVVDQGTIKSFASILTATGAVTPQILAVAGSGTPYVTSVSSDGTRDILYAIGRVADGDNEDVLLWIFDGASTLSGTLTPTTSIALGLRVAYVTVLVVDPIYDRLYLASAVNPLTEDVISVFDGASTLTASSTANRTITIEGATANAELTSLWVDPCHDNLYITDRNGSAGGKNVFGFHNASTLNTTLQMDTDAFVDIDLGAAMNVIVDGTDALFAWSDSANAVSIFRGISTRSGTITADLRLYGIVNDGYGMASVATP